MAGTTAYALYQNWSYIVALAQIFQKNNLSYTPIDLRGLPQVMLAFIQLLLVGTIIARTILPKVSDRFFLKVVSFGFGFGIIGLIATILADTQTLYLWTMEVVLIGLALCILLIQRLRFKRDFRVWLRSLIDIWKIEIPTLTVYECAVIVMVGIVAILVYYDAIFFPIVELDAIIYHASAAAIAFYNHGMPLIDGGGIGLGTSSNYPLLFSYLGTYFYLFAGGVNDLYLRSTTSTMWLLSVLTTYLVGSKIGGRRLGMLAMFLVAMVPSYASYAFQATQEATMTFFLALGFLFLIYALGEEGGRSYYLACGMAFGVACLTSYQALFFLLPLGLVLGVKYWQSEARRSFSLNILRLLIALVVVGSAPYLRNLILLHNPVYPFYNEIFQSPNLSPMLFASTIDILKYTAYSFVDPINPTYANYLIQLITFRSFFPLNATLVLPSLLMLPTLSIKEKRTLALFITIPTVLILTFPAPSVRYFWLLLPLTAVCVAGMLIAGYEASKQHHLASHEFFLVRLSRFALPILLLLMLVFPLFALLGVQNYTFYPIGDASQTNSYLRYFTNPGTTSSVMLPQIYGSDVSAWKWLDRNLGSGKVATFENRVYYMNFALQSPNSIFYLDGSHALPLYSMNDLPTILSFMRNEGIRYVFARSEDWTFNLFTAVPFTHMLASPYLPLLYADGLSQVFQVGPKSDPIVTGTALAYTYNLTQSYSQGRNAENVMAGDPSPRLFVETDNTLTTVNIEYLDVGSGSLTVNVFNPTSSQWLNSYVTIQKNGTNQTLRFSFLVPMNLVHTFTELGLYAAGKNFTITRITTSSPTITGRVAYRFTGQLQVSNLTSPPSIMIYLPIMNPGDRVSVQTMTRSYNFSLTVYRGYISLNQTSGWQLNHGLIISYPVSGGVQSPALQWSVRDSGIYTLLIALTDNTQGNFSVDVSILIAASA